MNLIPSDSSLCSDSKRFDIVALGELLIDFAPGGISPAGAALYECNPGGAPANVLTAAARQGGRTAFIGKVGEDTFGRLLESTLMDCGICTDGLLFDKNVRTTLAFVSLDKTGNRSFSFFRNPGADYMLAREDINPDLIKASRIFHFGSLSLTDEPARSATKFALDIAKENGLLISYDPNLRPPLWKSLDFAREQIVSCLGYADILKISDEEFTFLTGEKDYESNAAAFAERYGITCMFITLGPKGAFYCYKGICGSMPTYDVRVVDTTGSGDAFIGTALGQIAALPADGFYKMDEAELREIVAYSNAGGAMTSRMKGAIPAIPTTEQILECIRTIPLLV